MASPLLGSWKQVSADKYGELLDALGVPAAAKEVFQSNPAELEIGQEGDKWFLRSKVMGKTREDKFKLGEEIETTSIIGKAGKLTVTLEGDTLVETAQSAEGKIVTRRSVKGGQLVSEYTAGPVTATITFNKV